MWSVHPKYLDSKGLVALWREGLLARKVLSGGTRGYRNHPQLLRFRTTSAPEASIDDYLHGVVDEADRRGFRFDRSKLGTRTTTTQLNVTTGQMTFERGHLKRKLDLRDPERGEELPPSSILEAHPSFRVVDGPIASWERI